LDYFNERQGLILEYLREKGSASVHEVQQKLGIPTATLYRDIASLVRADRLRRSHGRLHYQQPTEVNLPLANCVMCGAGVNPRTALSIQLNDGRQAAACCPHCGLLYISRQPGVRSALVTDFLYGKMHNVRQAVYVLESQVQICCRPSLLCFANSDDASRFQAGFGGQVLSFEQAMQRLNHMMSLDSGSR
jgi:DNA-binding Lrp family transcriptional regulator